MYTFQVPRMSCGGCASSITRIIKQADSGAEVSIDVPTKTVKVESALGPSQLFGILTDAGYPPVSIQPTA